MGSGFTDYWSYAVPLTGAACCLVYCWRNREEIRERIITLVLSDSATRHPISDAMRGHFQTIAFNEPTPPADAHTHPYAARDRYVACQFIDRFAKEVGLHPFYREMSMADQANGRVGDRLWRWVKDARVEPCLLAPSANSLIVHIDNDYHMDMNQELARDFKPMLIYTLGLRDTAAALGEVSYTFDADNTLVYRVAGGAVYRHQLYDYAHDNVKAVRRFCGVPISVQTYLLERRAVTQEHGLHQLVLFVPIARWTFPWSLVAAWLEGPEVRRLTPVVAGDSLRIFSAGAQGMEVSTGIVGEYASIRVSAQDDAAIASLAATSTVTITLPSVQERVPKELKPLAPFLLHYHRKMAKLATTGGWLQRWRANPRPAMFIPVEHAVRRYAYTTADDEEKTAMVAFMQPIVYEAFSAPPTSATMAATVAQRVVRTPDVYRSSPFIETAIDEFVALCATIEGAQLSPTSYEVVWERRPRPSQRQALDGWAGGETDGRTLAAFLKRETYRKARATRLIVPMDVETAVEGGCFVYSAMDYMKSRAEWYVCGKTPREIAYRVAMACQETQRHVVCADIKEMDKHVYEISQGVYRRVMLRLFAAEHHPRLLKALASNCGRRVRLGDCVWDSETRQNSGGSETSLAQTLRAAFALFLAGRLQGLPAYEAWRRIVAVQGDDSLAIDIEVKFVEQAFGKLGFPVVADIVPRGERGVKFLSRYYTRDVWEGGPDSLADIRRAIGKLHVTTAMKGRTPIQILEQKLINYLLADLQTPILGDLAACYERVTGKQLAACTRDDDLVNYMTRCEPSEQYPNAVENHALEELQVQYPEFDYQAFLAHIWAIKHPDELLSMPLFADITAAPAADAPIVDDSIVEQPACGPSAAANPSRRAEKRARHARNKRGAKSENAEAVMGV